MHTNKIGALSLEFMDFLAERYGEDYGLGAVAIIADVIAGEDDHPTNPIVFSCSDPRRWVQVALLREGLEEAEALNESRHADAELED